MCLSHMCILAIDLLVFVPVIVIALYYFIIHAQTAVIVLVATSHVLLCYTIFCCHSTLYKEGSRDLPYFFQCLHSDKLANLCWLNNVMF